MRGVASQYNAWLHTQRWEDAIAAIMPAYAEGENAKVISMEIRSTERDAA